MKWRLDILSGPSALDAFSFLTAAIVCSVVKEEGAEALLAFNLFVTILDVFERLCGTTEEYCLLKPFAIFFGHDRYLPLNLMLGLEFSIETVD